MDERPWAARAKVFSVAMADGDEEKAAEINYEPVEVAMVATTQFMRRIQDFRPANYAAAKIVVERARGVAEVAEYGLYGTVPSESRNYSGLSGLYFPVQPRWVTRDDDVASYAPIDMVAKDLNLYRENRLCEHTSSLANDFLEAGFILTRDDNLTTDELIAFAITASKTGNTTELRHLLSRIGENDAFQEYKVNALNFALATDSILWRLPGSRVDATLGALLDARVRGTVDNLRTEPELAHSFRVVDILIRRGARIDIDDLGTAHTLARSFRIVDILIRRGVHIEVNFLPLILDQVDFVAAAEISGCFSVANFVANTFEDRVYFREEVTIAVARELADKEENIRKWPKERKMRIFDQALRLAGHSRALYPRIIEACIVDFPTQTPFARQIIQKLISFGADVSQVPEPVRSKIDTSLGRGERQTFVTLASKSRETGDGRRFYVPGDIALRIAEFLGDVPSEVQARDQATIFPPVRVRPRTLPRDEDPDDIDERPSSQYRRT